MWYSVRLLHERIIEDASPVEALFEEKLLVFRLEEGEDLGEKLTALAKSEEDEYRNMEGNTVRYVFREVLEVQKIFSKTIEDGTEVFYRFWDDPDDGDFEVMRRVGTRRWWLEDSDERE